MPFSPLYSLTGHGSQTDIFDSPFYPSPLFHQPQISPSTVQSPQVDTFCPAPFLDDGLFLPELELASPVRLDRRSG